MRLIKYATVILTAAIGLVACLHETPLPVVIDISAKSVADNNTTPLAVQITNTTKGADFIYHGCFESNLLDFGIVTYNLRYGEVDGLRLVCILLFLPATNQQKQETDRSYVFHNKDLSLGF